jgi:hypothetical protein
MMKCCVAPVGKAVTDSDSDGVQTATQLTLSKANASAEVGLQSGGHSLAYAKPGAHQLT